MVTKILLCVFVFLISCRTPPPKEGPIPTTLVVGLDGIAFSTFKKLQDGGYFRTFQVAAPMISTFPSTSDPNWNHIFQTGPEAMYTKAFFDPRIRTDDGQGQENGGLAAHLNRVTQYEAVMDFTIEGIWEHLTTFLWTESTGLYWMDSLETQFFNFRGREVFNALIINTDLLSHTVGEERVMRYLVAADKKLEAIALRYKKLYNRDLEIILVSDHGNAFNNPLDVPFQTVLESKGFILNGTISGPRDVGFYVPELLSFGSFFCQENSKRELAFTLASTPHIHVVTFQDGEKVRVLSQNGKSEGEIQYDEQKDSLSYRLLKGSDPLGQIGYFKKGPMKSQVYFEKSFNDDYPAAVLRIWEAFNVNSQIKPTVLASSELGFVFGNKALRLITDLRGFTSTHGSLHKLETNGIFVSNKRVFPAIRPQQFRDFVRTPGFYRK